VTPAKSIPVLPADAEALRALVLATMTERDAAIAERDQLLAEREALYQDSLIRTRVPNRADRLT
jgi:hypothetical protein